MSPSRPPIPTETFPVYILDLSGTDRIVVRAEREDLSHSEFWEQTVSATVAHHYRAPRSQITNLPYCQHRARIVLHGAKLSPLRRAAVKKPLKNIARATQLSHLEWRHDEHQRRLRLDVAEFENLLA